MVAGGSGTSGNESCREALPVPPDAKKKQVKGRGIKGSGKFWKTQNAP